VSVGGVGLVELDEFLVYSLKEEESYLTLNELFNFVDPKVSVSYEQMNSCLFKAYVSANETFTLIFSGKHLLTEKKSPQTLLIPSLTVST